ncbi:MAG: DUF2651 family protein [Clostridium sp.]|nr:DUF2651 family protein [Clostridium sp.]
MAYVLYIFPLLSFVFGVVGQLLIKNLYIVTIITFVVWLVLTFTVFNESFLIWVFVNTSLSLVGSGIIYFLKERTKI